MWIFGSPNFFHSHSILKLRGIRVYSARARVWLNYVYQIFYTTYNTFLYGLYYLSSILSGIFSRQTFPVVAQQTIDNLCISLIDSLWYSLWGNVFCSDPKDNRPLLCFSHQFSLVFLSRKVSKVAYLENYLKIQLV